VRRRRSKNRKKGSPSRSTSPESRARRSRSPNRRAKTTTRPTSPTNPKQRKAIEAPLFPLPLACSASGFRAGRPAKSNVTSSAIRLESFDWAAARACAEKLSVDMSGLEKLSTSAFRVPVKSKPATHLASKRMEDCVARATR
jgi:hypothetical protein